MPTYDPDLRSTLSAQFVIASAMSSSAVQMCIERLTHMRMLVRCVHGRPSDPPSPGHLLTMAIHISMGHNNKARQIETCPFPKDIEQTALEWTLTLPVRLAVWPDYIKPSLSCIP